MWFRCPLFGGKNVCAACSTGRDRCPLTGAQRRPLGCFSEVCNALAEQYFQSVINPRRACAARVTVVVLCVCVCVCPRPSSATRATKRQTRHTGGLSIVLASVLKRRFSYNGFVSEIAMAFPYERTVVGHFYTLIFRIPSVYYALDCTRAVNLYAHV